MNCFALAVYTEHVPVCMEQALGCGAHEWMPLLLAATRIAWTPFGCGTAPKFDPPQPGVWFGVMWRGSIRQWCNAFVTLPPENLSPPWELPPFSGSQTNFWHEFCLLWLVVELGKWEPATARIFASNSCSWEIKCVLPAQALALLRKCLCYSSLLDHRRHNDLVWHQVKKPSHVPCSLPPRFLTQCPGRRLAAPWDQRPAELGLALTL